MKLRSEVLLKKVEVGASGDIYEQTVKDTAIIKEMPSVDVAINLSMQIKITLFQGRQLPLILTCI